MSFTTDYSLWQKTNPGKSASDYRASLTAPTQNQIATPGASTTPTPNAVVNPIQRDYAREQEAMKKLNLNTLQMGMVEPKTVFEATYTPQELAGMGDYQSIVQRNQAKADLGATQRPTNSVMGILENALRAKNDAAKQQLGQSDLYAQAGLPTQGVSAYTTLMQSLAQRGQEMQDKYTSFKDQMTQTAGSMANVYNLAADKYKLLNEDYQAQADRLNSVVNNIIQQENQLELLQKKFAYDKELQKSGIVTSNGVAYERDKNGNWVPIEGTGTTGGSLANSRMVSDGSGASNGAGRVDPLTLTDYHVANGNLVDAEGNKVAKITGEYGADYTYVSGEKSHNAWDVVFNDGAVQALNGGSIVKKGYSPGTYGAYVWIQDPNGSVIQYGHLNNEQVNALTIGTEVTKGSVFAMQETDPKKMGKATGAHTDIRFVGQNETSLPNEVDNAGENLVTPEMTDVMAIGGLVYGTRISDKETDNVKKVVSENKDLDRFDLVMKVLGFNIEKNKELGEDLLGILQQVGGANGIKNYDWLSIANFLNNDQKKEAVSLVERYVYDKAQQEDESNYISESKVLEATTKANQLAQYIEQLNETGENPLGEFEGSIEQWLGRFKSKEAQTIATKATQIIKEFTKTFLGSAMTAPELDFYKPIIPQLGDDPANFGVKLDSLKTDPLAKLNSIRQTYNLPLLDEQTLTSKDKRVLLYDVNDTVAVRDKATGEIRLFPSNFEGLDSLPEGYEIVNQ